MLLSEFIHKEVIRTALSSNNKDSAIRELVDVLVESHEIPLSARDFVLDAVLEREHDNSSGMEHGVAIPHATSDKVEDVVGAMAVLPQGVEWGTLDGLPARIIVLLVLPRRNFTGDVSTLAGVSHLMRNKEFRQQLLQATDAAAIVKLIEDAEDQEFFHTKSKTAQ